MLMTHRLASCIWGLADILRSALLGVAAALLLANAAPAIAADVSRLAELGRRIYVEGILPDGTRLTATHFEGASVIAGTEAACVNCHRRSGYGSVEGRIIIPPVAGAVLFAPGAFASAASFGAKGDIHAAPPEVERFRMRSAYDEQKLLRALRDGLDPDGMPLRPPMARYNLDAQAVKALSAFLRQLSAESVSGIAGETLHLGTVITPDVPPPQREALLEVLRAFAAMRQSGGLRWQLHVWQLTGAPQDWEALLDEHYRQQPVFALLSGAGTAEWQPVHRFCEHRAVACVLPSVEFAPDRDRDYYSLYFSPGLALEARLLAHHLAAEPVPPRRLIQVVADDSGERAGAALREALDRAGNRLAMQQLTPKEYAAMQPSEQDAVVWWLHPPQIAALVSAAPDPVQSVPLYLSALLAPPEELVVPNGWKRSLRYASIFDPLAVRRAQATLVPWLARHGIAETNLRLRGDAYAACNFFNNAVTAVQMQTASGIPGPLTQERLLEALESGMTVFRDDGAPYYWQLSMGPGQRFPVKGGMLLHYTPDATELAPLTARIVP